MFGTARHANQITRLDLNRCDATLPITNVKQPTASDYESYFVFIMPMFAIELGKHLFQSGSFRVDVYNVSCHVAALSFQVINFSRVGLQDFLGRSVLGYGMRWCPTFVIDSKTFQTGANLILAFEGLVFIRQCYQSHNSNFLIDRFTFVKAL